MIEKTQIQREKYTKLIEKHIIDPTKLEGDVNIVNPLMKNSEVIFQFLLTFFQNPWTQYFKDGELEKLIQQDLNRLFPEHEHFFHLENVQKNLKRILLVWSKENPNPSYRQGMHEILATIYLVLFRDVKPKEELKECKEELAVLFNDEYLEHDTYILFEQLMKKMKDFFEVKTVKTKKQNNLFETNIEEEFSSSDNYIIDICVKIQNVLLKKRDPLLSEHLKKLKIEPQIYGLRWIRLLFGREFKMEDVLVIWDAIFSNCGGKDLKEGEIINLELVEHLSVAMLIFLSRELKQLDYNDCLTKLLKYPRVKDVQLFITDALASSRNEFKGFNPTQLTNIKHIIEKKEQNVIKKEEKQCVEQRVKPIHNIFGEEPQPQISDKEKQIKIGIQMEKVINIIQEEFLQPSEKRDEVSISIAIAELKHLKDILKGSIPFDESTFHDYKKLKEFKEKKKEEQVVKKPIKFDSSYELSHVKGDIGLN